MSQRCQTPVNGRGRSVSRTGSQVKVCISRPQSAKPAASHVGAGCRPGCTACCRPATTLHACPLGIYVERVKNLKPVTEFFPSCSKMDGMSTYREFYYPKCGEKVKSFKPASTFDPSCAKFDGMTTYREFYYPKCGKRSESCKPNFQFDPSCAKMDGISTYRTDFIGVQTDRVKSLKPSTVFDPSCAKMDGISTYRFNYIPYCPREIGRPESYKKTNDVEFSCAPFEGMSTYRGEFWQKPIIRTQSLKPTVRGAFSDAKFADRTTYRNDYFPFHFDKNCRNCIPQCLTQEESSHSHNFCPNGNGGQRQGEQHQPIQVSISPVTMEPVGAPAQEPMGMGMDCGCNPPVVQYATCPVVDKMESQMEGGA